MIDHKNHNENKYSTIIEEEKEPKQAKRKKGTRHEEGKKEDVHKAYRDVSIRVVGSPCTKKEDVYRFIKLPFRRSLRKKSESRRESERE
jgi:precorrin isomerase